MVLVTGQEKKRFLEELDNLKHEKAYYESVCLVSSTSDPLSCTLSICVFVCLCLLLYLKAHHFWSPNTLSSFLSIHVTTRILSLVSSNQILYHGSRA